MTTEELIIELRAQARKLHRIADQWQDRAAKQRQTAAEYMRRANQLENQRGDP